MYRVKKGAAPELDALVARGFVDKISSSSSTNGGGRGGGYVIDGTRFTGLHWQLKRRYYPLEYKVVRQRTRTTRKCGSSRALGKAVERAIDRHVFEGKPLRNALAKAVVRTLREDFNQEIVAAQLPVLCTELQCVTQCDYIARNIHDGSLHVWELKTGWPVVPRSPPSMRGALSGVACTPFNQWDLQCAWTARALERDARLPLGGEGRVIHVWRHSGGGGGEVRCVARAPNARIRKLVNRCDI